jgi:hypothetical protein
MHVRMFPSRERVIANAMYGSATLRMQSLDLDGSASEWEPALLSGHIICVPAGVAERNMWFISHPPEHSKTALYEKSEVCRPRDRVPTAWYITSNNGSTCRSPDVHVDDRDVIGVEPIVN